MKNQNLIDLDSSSSYHLEIEVEGYFRVRLPARTEKSRARRNPQLTESEYLTVSYNFTMNRKSRRILLQTVLDSLFYKEEFVLNLGEYILIEDLISKIIELDPIETNQQQKWKKATEEILGIALLILKVVPLSTRIESKSEKPGQRQELFNLIEDQLSFFSISDPRTFQSRIQTYLPSRFVEFTVEIPLYSNNKDRSSKRYDSYCKGYGESGSKIIRTPIDWEIDGEDVFSFEETSDYQPVQLLFLYEERIQEE